MTIDPPLGPNCADEIEAEQREHQRLINEFVRDVRRWNRVADRERWLGVILRPFRWLQDRLWPLPEIPDSVQVVCPNCEGLLCVITPEQGELYDDGCLDLDLYCEVCDERFQ